MMRPIEKHCEEKEERTEPMTCSQIRNILALYAGGDLDNAAEAREVEAHLASCEACRAEVDALRASLGALKAAGATEESLPETDPGYWVEVESKLRERALGVDQLRLDRPTWRTLPALLAQAALVLFAAGATIWFMASHHQPAGPSAPTAVAKGTPNGSPLYVLVNAPDRYANAEVAPVSDDSSNIYYSDVNHVVRPDEVKRFQRQVTNASYTEDARGGF